MAPVSPRAARARHALGKLKHVALSSLLLGTVIAVYTWPVGNIAPAPGLDPSWVAGLYMAADRGLDAGTQIIFTYGPLGFLGLPDLFEIWLGRLAFAWTALVQIALCVGLLWSSRRAFGLIVGLLVTILAASLPATDAILFVATMIGAAALFGDWSHRARVSLAVGAGALTATQLLGSLRAGPTLAVMAVAVLVALPDRRRTLSLFFGSLVVFFFLFWFATGQGLGNLGDYLVNTASVVSGYSESMVFPQPGLWWQTPAMLVAMSAVAVLCMAAIWGKDRLRQIGLLVMVAAVTFLAFKHAVVRESPGSITLLLGALLTIGLALVPHVRRPIAIVAIVVLASLAYAAKRDIIGPSFYFTQRAESFRQQLGAVVIPGRAEKDQQLGRETMQETYGLTAAELALLRSGTVHVAPWEAGVAWAYNLDWDPLPIFQQYTAYTQRLDKINAAKLESAAAPDMILWENTAIVDPNAINIPGAIDARWPAFESPAQMVQMFCRYRAARWDEKWAVLRDSPDRCGRERPLKTVGVDNSEAIKLPRTRPNEALLVRVEGLEVSGVERLRALLFRAANRHVLFPNAVWNVVGATAPDGLLLRVPHWADYPGKFALDSKAATVGFERVGGFLTGVDGSTKLTLHFSALPLDAPAILPAAKAQKRRVQR